MTTFRTLLLLLAAGFAADPVVAAQSCCHRKTAAVHTKKMPILLALFQPRPTVNLGDVARLVLATDSEDCEFMAAVRRWEAWRARNPRAKSRFPKAPSVSVLSLDSDEPEPDPSGLGCGCDPFLGSCGYWHATFGGMFLSK